MAKQVVILHVVDHHIPEFCDLVVIIPRLIGDDLDDLPGKFKCPGPEIVPVKLPAEYPGIFPHHDDAFQAVVLFRHNHMVDG